ncbi:MAG: tetratricopeptide repeat protein [Deltaproteobacteria bacterium]|nr:tetratricopeptide repeat protein [Deltaproteobacteria bacterium]
MAETYEAWMDQCREAIEAGDGAAALEAVSQALELDPDSVPALGYRATLLGQAGQHAEALALFDRVVELEPERGAAHYSRGLHLERLGRFDEALAAYSRAIEVDPTEPNSLINRGRLLDDSGQPAEAVADYDRALALDDTEVIAWTNRGNSLTALERFDEALASYDRALALDDSWVTARLGRARALLSLGRIDEANAARPVDDDRDPGEIIERRHPLSDGELVLRYFPGGHSHPEVLASLAQTVLEHCAAFEGTPPGLVDGVTIHFGWSMLTLRQRGTDRVLCEPDFSRHPLTELRHEVTFSLQVQFMTQVMHQVVDAPVSDTNCFHTVAADPKALGHNKLTMYRVSEVDEEGFSGWLVGPETPAARAEMIEGGDYELVPAAMLARLRAHLIKVLTLPPGFAVTFDGHAVVSVCDPEGTELWAVEED